MPRWPDAPSKYILALLEKFPDAPALTLAKLAWREHPEYWSSLDNCRSMVRYYLGTRGKKNRIILQEKRFMRAPRKAGWAAVIPESLVQFEDWRAVQIDGAHRALILSDIHVPFHDPEALELALDWGLKKKPSLVIFNGDTVDHYAQSKFITDPKLRDFPGEVLAAKQLFAGVRKRFGKSCRIICKHGNHEERFEVYMRHKCPELLGLPQFEWASVFGLEETKIELVKDKRPIRLGKLNVIHGHEYNFAISNPVNAARGFFLRAKTHVLGGHFHQSSNHSEKSLDGKQITTWSTGCLCSLHPEYRPINNWGHGFAWVEVDAEGAFHVDNLRIINGKVYH